jgi:hypothetical protein
LHLILRRLHSLLRHRVSMRCSLHARKEEVAYHASEMYRERRDLLLAPCEPSSAFLLLP